MMYLVSILSTVGSSFASYFLKRASGSSLAELLKNKYLYLGCGLYACVSLTTVWLLQWLPYTTVIPLGAFGFIWTMLISKCLLGERITVQKISGLVLIFFGVLCVVL